MVSLEQRLAAADDFRKYSESHRWLRGDIVDDVCRHIVRGEAETTFVRMVMEHRVYEAILCGTSDESAQIVNLVCAVCNCVPGAAHGSPERVREWQRMCSAEFV